jgi:hypothetical protein
MLFLCFTSQSRLDVFEIVLTGALVNGGAAAICSRKTTPWEDGVQSTNDSGFATAVAASVIVLSIVTGGVTQDAVSKRKTALRLANALRSRLAPLGPTHFSFIPALAWLALDCCFRCAAFTARQVPWSTNVDGLVTFLNWFLWTAPISPVLLFAVCILLVFTVLWVKYGWNATSSDHTASTHKLAQVLPMHDGASSTGSVELPAWKSAFVALGKLTAGVLFLPFGYILLQPWLCEYRSSSSAGSFVTSECGSPLQCWSAVHIVTLVVSALLLGTLFVTLLKSTFDLSDMKLWSFPHFLTVTLSSRMLLAWSARVLILFNTCWSCFLSLYLNIVLTTAAVVFAIVYSAMLPTWLIVLGGVVEAATLLFGFAAVGAVMHENKGCTSALAAFVAACVLLAVVVVLLIRKMSKASKESPEKASKEAFGEASARTIVRSPNASER